MIQEPVQLFQICAPDFDVEAILSKATQQLYFL